MEEITLRFKKANSFGIADSIMALLSKGEYLTEVPNCDAYTKKYGIDVFADGWDNCREQGYRLNGDVLGRRFSVCFGEHRNIDCPTIWHSEGCRWPDEGKWKKEEVNTVEEAVTKIVELVKSYIERYSAELASTGAQ